MLAGHLKQPRERQSISGKGGQLAAAAKACQPQILERDCGGPGGGVGCAEDPQIFVLQDRCLPVGCRNAAGCHMCPPPLAPMFPPQCSECTRQARPGVKRTVSEQELQSTTNTARAENHRDWEQQTHLLRGLWHREAVGGPLANLNFISGNMA